MVKQTEVIAVMAAMPAAWRWVYGMASSIRTSDGMVLAERFFRQMDSVFV